MGTTYCTAPSQCRWLGLESMRQLLNVWVSVHRRGNHMKELSADKDKDLGDGEWWLTWKKGRLWLSSSPYPKHSFYSCNYMPYWLLFKTIYNKRYIVYFYMYYFYTYITQWDHKIYFSVTIIVMQLDGLIRFLTAFRRMEKPPCKQRPKPSRDWRRRPFCAHRL